MSVFNYLCYVLYTHNEGSVVQARLSVTTTLLFCMYSEQMYLPLIYLTV